MRSRLALLLAALPLAVASLPSSAAPYTGDPLAEGVGKDLVPVARIAYKSGTDIEFVTIKGRDYALAPSQAGSEGGLRIIDITNPERPRVTGFLECSVAQLDVQVRGTLVFLGVDYNVKGAQCFEQLGITPDEGLLVIDISKPNRPRSVGFVKVPLGVHNSTLHPSGKFVYVSDSELEPVIDQEPGHATGRIQIIDVSNPRAPKQVGQLGLPTGLSSHDITFNKKGDRAYSAAISETLILDTTNPAKPTIKTTILDPAVNISHGADPTPDGKYLLVTDEQAGAAANGVCNVGGVHVYDISVELAPVKVGYYPFNPTNSATATTNSNVLTCTAHVLDYSPDGTSFSNAGYAAGVRIVSIKSLTGVPQELAYFTAKDADTWSAKTYKNPKYIFANDLKRGLDIFRYMPGKGNVDTRPAAEQGKILFRTEPTTFAAGQYCFSVKR